MSGWDEIDPKLKLERIRVRNFRNISDIDVTIPEDKNIICLVGPNGGGKSALFSLIINALCNLTGETVHDRNDEAVTPGFSKFRLLWSREEIGPEGSALAFAMDWKSQHINFQYKFFVSNSGNDDFAKHLGKVFSVHPETISHGWERIVSDDNASMKTLRKAGDPIAPSVLLFRPSDRFEVPYYETRHNLSSSSPRTEFNWAEKRPYPIGSKSSLSNLESLVLDMKLDDKIGYQHAKKAIDNLVEAADFFRKKDEKLVVRPWPFRRVGLGRLEALSLLSGGELDILVTVGDIITQQIYLMEKFDPDGDREVMPSGWVFIDEVDSHLHPQWQQKVLPFLSDLFPTINFMVTTHSPFVLRSLPKDKSMVIRLPDGEVFDEDFSSWRIDDILDVVFNVPSLWSEEVEEQLNLLQNCLSDTDKQEKAVEIYSELANRSSSLRSACDRLIALYASPEIRDRISLREQENIREEEVSV